MMIILVLALLLSCSKEPNEHICIIPEDIPCESSLSMALAPDTCITIPFDQSGIGHAYFSRGFNYRLPDFNVENENEFLYGRSNFDVEPEIGEIWKVNICTGEHTFIVNAEAPLEIHFQPEWGKNDWIVFSGRDLSVNSRDVTIIKSNGDSLTFLKNDAIKLLANGPIWCYNGEVIYIRVRELNGDRPFLLMDSETAEILDTIPFQTEEAACNNDKMAVGLTLPGSDQRIGYIELETKMFVELTDIPDHPGYPYDIDWLDDNTIIWSDYEGIYSIDIMNNQIDTLKSICPEGIAHKTYYDLSASPKKDGTFLTGFIQRTHIPTGTGRDSVLQESFISLFDANTREEYVFDLEQ